MCHASAIGHVKPVGVVDLVVFRKLLCSVGVDGQRLLAVREFTLVFGDLLCDVCDEVYVVTDWHRCEASVLQHLFIRKLTWCYNSIITHTNK